MNFYNELDPKAAAWLRELIKAGEIPDGIVDERSITEIKPSDLDGFTQCHFFAGIGGWPFALKLAGWPNDRPVWTGSLPCQPFSTAGLQLGEKDERHLWPVFFELVKACRPLVIFGEQVSNAKTIGSTSQKVQQVQKTKAALGISIICGTLQRRTKASLCIMPEKIRNAMEEDVEGEVKKGSVDTITKGQGVQPEIQSRASGSLPSGANTQEMLSQGDCFRLKHSLEGDRSEDHGGKMRDNGYLPGFTPRDDETRETPEHSINRQNKSQGGLRHKQHPNSMSCCKLSDEQLGRVGIPSDCKSMDRENQINANELTRNPELSDEAAIGKVWIDGVFADLESAFYSCGAVSVPAGSVGAPHKRQRLYWMAYSRSRGSASRLPESQQREERFTEVHDNYRAREHDSGVTQGDAKCAGLEGQRGNGNGGNEPGRIAEIADGSTAEAGATSELANRQYDGWSREQSAWVRRTEATHDSSVGRLAHSRHSERCAEQGDKLRERDSRTRQPGAWSNYDLIWCRDECFRRVESSSLAVVNGLPSLMGIDGEKGYGKMEEEIVAYADAKKIRPGEALSSLWMSLVEETIQSGFGGQIGFHSPPILLSFLRELTDEGWPFAQSLLCASQKTEEALLRSLWWQKDSSRPPCKRGLDGQQPEKSTDSLRVLSSILARHVETHWSEAVFAYADHGFPLANGIKGRVGLLRGYGNAIVPQVAAEFIQACVEAINEVEKE